MNKYHVLCNSTPFETAGNFYSLLTLLETLNPRLSVRVKRGIFYNNEETFDTVEHAIAYYKRECPDYV